MTAEPAAENLWSNCIPSIRAQVSDAVWKSTFSSTKAVALDNGELVISVPGELQKNRIEARYLGVVEEAVKENAPDTTIRVVIESGWDELDIDLNAPAVPPPPPAPAEPAPDAPPPWLHQKFTFDQFVIGASNRFAHAAALSVAETPAASYNPLFIHGDSGLGKTHLLQAISHYIATHYPNYRVRYVTSETFLNEFVDSIRTSTSKEFKQTYRRNDVLLVDDIQFIEGKQGFQEEFFHTFNDLHQNHKQIVLSSDRAPDAIPTLLDRLRSRFKWGLITDIQHPDLETRLAILHKKRKTGNGSIPDEVLTFIAENITDSIRELEGALIKTTAYCNLTQQICTVDLAREVLADLVSKDLKPPITAEAILETAATGFGFPVEQMTGGSRRRPLVEARQIAMYVTRNMTDLSFPEIGRVYGNRDHTTVMHAVRKIESRMSERRQIFDKVQHLQHLVNKSL